MIRGGKQKHCSVEFNTKCAGMNIPPVQHDMSQNSDCIFFLLFNFYLISLMFLIFVHEFLLLPMKTEKISWQRPVSPHYLLPFADSGRPEKHLKHRDVSEPELSAFPASLFSLLALLSQCLFAWHHIKTYLCWDFWNLPIQPQQCPYFPFHGKRFCNTTLIL